MRISSRSDRMDAKPNQIIQINTFQTRDAIQVKINAYQRNELSMSVLNGKRLK